MVNRHVVGAHYGLRDWLFQMITAAVLLIYTVIFAVDVALAPKLDFAAWRMLFAPQWMKLATSLFLLSVFLHAWIGVRNIFMDYVKSNSLRFVLDVLAVLWLITCTFWSVRLLWSI